MASRWLIRNVLFPLHERLKGHCTYEILREMEAADRMPAAELEALSAARLRELIQYSYRNVPYIRTRMQERGVNPEDIQSAADLVQLPVMTKADIRANRAQLHSVLTKKLVPY